jgi:serine/threonine protein kinase
MSENDESLPRLLGGRYRLEAKLGSGGMGVVYRATDLTMKRSVAVKLIRGVDGVALDEEVAGRFLREAKNTARVQHENIIEVYDLGRSDQGDMFFVMELLEGESLSTKIRRDGKMAPAVAVNIARQMCAALHVAHAAGIIHRDLKPANVMLIERGGQTDYVKVLDFGVAKSYTPDQQTQLTHTGMLVGTVEYMAPEQIMGRVVDGRTDIYSLGIVMYRMLTGKAPFRDGGVPALIHAHLNVFPKPMTDTAPELPGTLDRVVLRCLAKQPEQRYESMEEVSRALASALEPENLGLVSLEYDGGDDPYDAGVKTEVARSPRESRPDVPSAAVSAPPPPRPNAGLDARPDPRAVAPRVVQLDDTYDDATIKMDRPEAGALGRKRGTPPPPVPAADEVIDRTAIMSREESTAKRSIPEEVRRIDSSGPRECAMCRTMNPPHARACSACGVSLAREDQEAVRARVAAPRTAHLPAPQMPPPTTGGYAAPSSSSFGHAPQAAAQPPSQGGPHHPHASHGGNSLQGMAWGTLPPNTHPPQMHDSRALPRTAWQRFLTWTGLKAR